MKKEKLQGLEKTEKDIFEKINNDVHFKKVFQEATDGKRRVLLVTKGYRPMFQRCYQYGFNYFMIDGYDQDIPVPIMCFLLEIDPILIQDAYFNYRNHERWPRLKPELDKEIFTEQKQIVTNLFPFPTIEWFRESGSTGILYLINKIDRTPPFLSVEQIQNLCQPGKIISKSYHRHFRKKQKAKS